MNYFNGETVGNAYYDMYNELTRYGHRVGDTWELTNVIFEVEKPSLQNISFRKRHISERYANEELKWYWSGDNRCETIGKHAKMWLRLTDDGVTNNSAYGYILNKKYGFNQIEQIINLLRKDSNSRRAVLNISDPSIDRIHTKDMQCTIAIQFLIRNDKLETTVYMRSNDIYFGLPYDYIYFISIATYISQQLGVKLGRYTHNATSMHMYVKDIENFKDTDQCINIDLNKILEENYEK